MHDKDVTYVIFENEFKSNHIIFELLSKASQCRLADFISSGAINLQSLFVRKRDR